jgi:hypothetical protein
MKVQKVDRRVTKELCAEQRKIVCIVEWETDGGQLCAWKIEGKLK